jgi:alkylation response protein AidB-like acyl-CoA dehydrogenase
LNSIRPAWRSTGAILSDPVVDEEAFRQEALAFLRAHAPERRPGATTWGEGPDRVGLFDDVETEQRLLRAARAWRRTLFDNGFGWLSGPVEHGGRGLPRWCSRVFAQLEDLFDAPDQMRLSVGLGMVGPTIVAHGSDEARARYLSAIYRGDTIACQLFSEPGAGSDLASIRTRADRDGDGWRLSGQKVWTSGGHFSDIGMVLARTGDDESRHRGLTMFLIDMSAPGVDVRPLRQMTGDASFDEVFLDDVVTTDVNRLGAVGDGWSVMMTTLLNERGSIGGGGRGVGGGDYLFRRLVEVARHLGRGDEPMLRQSLADLHIRLSISDYFQGRMAAIGSNGRDPGPLVALSKVMLTENLQRTSRLASQLLGPSLVADSGAWGTYAWSELILGTPGLRVGGGTDEVQKNMLGERVLGLPREPRAS